MCFSSGEKIKKHQNDHEVIKCEAFDSRDIFNCV